MPTLLIIDDEPDLRKTLAVRFAAKGYKVLSAADGRDALDQIRRRPDAILLDLHMAGLDGLATLREIKALSPESRVIAMSAEHSSSRAALMLEEGAYDFVPKPLDFDYLELTLSLGLAAGAR
jgi:DNA-binding response OmpR family regulator